jgi:hypothetical protein
MNKRVVCIELVAVLSAVAVWCLLQMISTQPVRRVVLGNIVNGKFSGSIEMPATAKVFLDVQPNGQKELLNGRAECDANGKTIYSFHFCAERCPFAGISTGQREPDLSIQPCEATSPGIDILQVRRQNVKIEITLDIPNERPMEVALSWAD